MIINMKIVLLHDAVGGSSRTDELDVLDQVTAVGKTLREMGHTTANLPATLDLLALRRQLIEARPDLVFNLVEALGGIGRLIYLAPALLDALNIPYAGANTEAMFLTSNKLLTKQLLAAHGVDTPAWFDPARSSHFEGGRYIIKSVWEEASVGLDEDSVGDFADASALSDDIRHRLPSLGGCAFAEQFIEGREFNIALLSTTDGGVQVLPPAEIDFSDYAPGKVRVVGYKAKWDEGSFEYSHTPRRFDFPPADRQLLDSITRICKRCWDLFDLCGWVRVDFRVDAAGRPFVLEINANPCLTPEAGFHAATVRAGLPYTEVMNRIIGAALARAATTAKRQP
jgi:D-alanine-D-alanine ligase